MDNWKTRKGHSGFTLMEMLIVVAMIAVLVAISIPTFTNILEKAGSLRTWPTCALPTPRYW